MKGTGYTEVRLDGRCKCDLEQQRNEGGGYATQEGVKSPGAYLDNGVLLDYFCMDPVIFGTTSRALVAYHMERGVKPFHDAVGVNCNMGAGAQYMGACWIIVSV